MTTASDVIHELTGLHTDIAKRLDDTPTGVTPGYNAALGGTVLPNGKLRYVGGTAHNLLAIATRGASSAVNIAQGASVRLPFGTATYGGSAVTPGATAYITVPVTAVYRIDIAIGMRGVNGAYALGDFFDISVYRQADNALLTGSNTFAYANIDAGTYTPFIPINGACFLSLTAGDGIYLKAENQCSVVGNATAPRASGDFFAVSYA